MARSDRVVVAVKALGYPDRWFHAAVLVLHDGERVLWPQLAIVTVSAVRGIALVDVGGRHGQLEDQRLVPIGRPSALERARTGPRVRGPVVVAG